MAFQRTSSRNYRRGGPPSPQDSLSPISPFKTYASPFAGAPPLIAPIVNLAIAHETSPSTEYPHTSGAGHAAGYPSLRLNEGPGLAVDIDDVDYASQAIQRLHNDQRPNINADDTHRFVIGDGMETPVKAQKLAVRHPSEHASNGIRPGQGTREYKNLLFLLSVCFSFNTRSWLYTDPRLCFSDTRFCVAYSPIITRSAYTSTPCFPIP